MTTPRLVPLRRMTLVEQQPVDQPAHRDPLHGAVQAACTHATFRASLDHTESAVAAMDADEPKPGRYWVQHPPRKAPRWLVLAVFFAIGWFATDVVRAVAKLWATLP